jgi:hypothetical protein
MNTIPLAPRRSGPTAGHFVVHVAGESHEIRAVAIWPIAEALGADGQTDTLDAHGTLAAGDTGADDAAMLADLMESLLIAPPRPRHRRQRLVSSRAVFYRG